jgi:ABC-type oligopeptide transport system, periplasmic component
VLQEAGFVIKDGKRVTPQGEPISVEFLLDEPSFQPHHMPFIKNLNTLGIEANLRIVDPVQYRKRVDDFDFDLTVQRFGFSTTPGDSLRIFFSSQARRCEARRTSPAFPIRSSMRSSRRSSPPITARA